MSHDTEITITIGPPHDPRHPCYFCDGQAGTEGLDVKVGDRDTTRTAFSVCPDCLTCAPDQLAARACAKDRPFRTSTDARGVLPTDLPVLQAVAEGRAVLAYARALDPNEDFPFDEDDFPF